VATIGVGRNLVSVGLSDDEIEILFANDLQTAHRAAARVCKPFPFISDERQEVLVNMAFNLGEASLSAFKNMLDAIAKADWQRAAAEMRNSKWARQVGSRAERLAKQMETGRHQGIA
jgi:lysozyme